MTIKMLRPLSKSKGFSLVELLISMSIISILTVIAVPNMLVQRMIANHAAAVGALKTIAAAQTDWNNRFKAFNGDLTLFGQDDPRFLDRGLTNGFKNAYVYTMDAEAVDSHGLNASWSAEAHPAAYRRTGVFSFYIDETVYIRGLDVAGAPGDASMPTFN